LSAEKENARLLRKEGAALRKELNALRPDADQGGPRQRPGRQGLTVVTGFGGSAAAGGSGDGNTEGSPQLFCKLPPTIEPLDLMTL
jgi:hypothetical protein